MMPKTARDLHVTLSPRGEFYLNEAAMIKLGEPVAVRLMSDKIAGLIGITAAPLKAKASFELRMKYGEDSPGRIFRATEFCRHLGLQFDRTVLFREPKVEDGVLVLNINTTVYARKRAMGLAARLREEGVAPAKIAEMLGTRM